MRTRMHCVGGDGAHLHGVEFAFLRGGLEAPQFHPPLVFVVERGADLAHVQLRGVGQGEMKRGVGQFTVM